jgi:DNA-directed RNA polymerase subunit alpha
MSQLITIINSIKENKDHFSSFLIEPLELGQGITLGNSIRRTILSDLSGLAITGVRINNLKHEFESIKGVREDVLEILLNLKETIFQESIFYKNQKTQHKVIKGFLNVKGPVIVTASMLKLPKDIIRIINPAHYICTIIDTSQLFLEVDIEKGKGYRLVEQTRKEKLDEIFDPVRPSTLMVDAVFMPIKKVNYKIKLITDTRGYIKESLSLDILTNGSITPKRALIESIKALIDLFSPLLINSNFLALSSQISKEFFTDFKAKKLSTEEKEAQLPDKNEQENEEIKEKEKTEKKPKNKKEENKEKLSSNNLKEKRKEKTTKRSKTLASNKKPDFLTNIKSDEELEKKIEEKFDDYMKYMNSLMSDTSRQEISDPIQKEIDTEKDIDTKLENETEKVEKHIKKPKESKAPKTAKEKKKKK